MLEQNVVSRLGVSPGYVREPWLTMGCQKVGVALDLEVVSFVPRA